MKLSVWVNQLKIDVITLKRGADRVWTLQKLFFRFAKMSAGEGYRESLLFFQQKIKFREDRLCPFLT
ncbi:hypothetical protein DVQ00_04355 [Yersinia enterocolitica]|nr:hypothetical protein C2U38_06590 [Citrobacter freundii complex sp. CFNIH3]EKN5983299.1 hypothetical protein [Yersinia enterocolitica]POV66820.1 hypothetical protein C3411_18595 [Citrobacter freundii complex sp. CFNIH5]EKN5987591.1 hypothetical protein [Yersinia enterocolitica]EKN6168311.1 hypothetical protein [Yersinia enterocolitica]